MRDNWAAFKEHGITLFGVNPGSSRSHQKFKSAHEFPFPLLVDKGRKVAARYGAGGFFVKRSVYGIGIDGRVRFAERGMSSPERILGAVKDAAIR